MLYTNQDVHWILQRVTHAKSMLKLQQHLGGLVTLAIELVAFDKRAVFNLVFNRKQNRRSGVALGKLVF